jgi:hypothetical protein
MKLGKQAVPTVGKLAGLILNLNKIKKEMTTTQIKTPSDLKFAVERSSTDSFFFTRSSMKFFGDTMQNYGLRQPAVIVTTLGKTHAAYELYRKHPVKHGNQQSAWFDSVTFNQVFPRC